MKISDISVELSTKYRISATTEEKSVMEIPLRGKSLKNQKFRRNFVNISVSDRNFGEISVSRTHARVGDFFFKISKIYRKYRSNIGDIWEISVKISKIYRYISVIYREISEIYPNFHI